MFAQSQEPGLDLVALVRQATRFFRAELNVLARLDAGAEVELTSAADGNARATITVRRAKPTDVDDAWHAERAGQAGGMASLAERCSSVWEVQAQDGADAAALHRLCALLASVALGPVLPPDRATLYGVRGAAERAERAARPR